MFELLKKYRILLNHKQKISLLWITFITIIGTLFEVMGVSLIIPLVSSMLNPNIINENALIHKVCNIFNITSHNTFVLVCIFSLVVVFIIKNLFILYENKMQSNFVFKNRFNTEEQLLASVLSKPYSYFLNLSSGDLIRIIRNDVVESYSLLNNIMTLFADGIVSFAIGLVVLLIDPLMSLICISMLVIIILVINKIIKPILRRKGEESRKEESATYKWLLQAIQGIKEIKVAQKESFFSDNFNKSGSRQVEAAKTYNILSTIPKLIIEMGCVCAMLITIAILILLGKDPQTLLPSISAFAMAALKLMPIANRIIGTSNSIAYNGPAVDKLINTLKAINDTRILKNKGDEEDLTIKKEIKLENISFTYPNSNEVILKKATLTIPVGKSIGIIGKSGSGKTTAIDIMLGLLEPQEGKVLVDNKDVSKSYHKWLDKVGYIPQSIFMMDDTIASNIAFGSKLDETRVWDVLEEAQLADYVRTLPDTINTKIGERGIRLSGGQRQRIGIARALYNDPELLVFDEATSSLDGETEKAIMDSINRLHGKKTMVIIAHRLETIKECDEVYKVTNHKIVKDS